MTHVLIQLGTNDVRTPAQTFPAGHRPLGNVGDGTTAGVNGSFAKNVSGIITAVLAAGIKVILPGVPYFFPTSSFNGVVWDDASLNLAQSYNGFLTGLVDGVNIFGPTTSTFEYFADNQGEFYHENSAGTNGVHPNATGVNSYGVIHAQTIAKAVGLIGGSSATAATTYSLILPPSPMAGLPGAIGVLFNQPLTTATTVTLTDNSATFVGGPSVTVAAGSSFGSVSWSPSTSGPHTIGVSHTGQLGLTDPASSLLSVASSGGLPVQGTLASSGVSFSKLRQGGLSGQVKAIVSANPSLSPGAVSGLNAANLDSLDRAYRGLSELITEYLQGAPIATTEMQTRLNDYVLVFNGYAQAATEIAALVQANPGTMQTGASPSGIGPITQRTFS